MTLDSFKAFTVRVTPQRVLWKYTDVHCRYGTDQYYMYTAIRSLYSHVVCNVSLSCKFNGDRNQLRAWTDSDPISRQIHVNHAPVANLTLQTCLFMLFAKIKLSTRVGDWGGIELAFDCTTGAQQIIIIYYNNKNNIFSTVAENTIKYM